jgi:D-amino-acid dehydrogenase
MKSILVIGGGLVGAASALRLQAAGVSTVLIDPGDKRRGASFGNAGHIGAEQVMPWSTWGNLASAPAHLFGAGGPLDFRWSDIGLWAPWSLRFMAASDPKRVAASHAALTAILRDAMGAWQRLETLAGMPGMVRPHGQANLYMSAEAGDKARELWSRTPIGVCRFREMGAGELARYAGVLRQAPASGLHFDGTGQVSDPQGARDGIMAKFAALGGEVIADSVDAVNANASVRLRSGQSLSADALLIACGAWSAPLMRQLGVNAPLIGERG